MTDLAVFNVPAGLHDLKPIHISDRLVGLCNRSADRIFDAGLRRANDFKYFVNVILHCFHLFGRHWRRSSLIFHRPATRAHFGFRRSRCPGSSSVSYDLAKLRTGGSGYCPTSGAAVCSFPPSRRLSRFRVRKNTSACWARILRKLVEERRHGPLKWL
jgi:hypothetical protein